MPETTSKGEKSFKANMEALFEELGLAFQWDRPSLLLAINKSSLGREKARQALQKRLLAAGHTVTPLVIDEMHPDAAVVMLGYEKPSGSVFFVEGLERGGGAEGKDAYRALNLSRELFVENRLKVVFWLTPNEAASLMRLAPDFWAFRHRVIEFASPAPKLSHEILSRLLIWPGPEMPVAPAELEEKIRGLEDTMKELPQVPDSLSMRIESYYLIGHACWAAGDQDKALKSLIAGMGLAQDKGFESLNSWLLSGVAILQQERGHQKESLEIFQDLAKHDPSDALLLMNTGIALCSVGRNADGVKQAAKAVNQESGNIRLWDSFGHLQLALGKFEAARDCFLRAAALIASAPGPRESLAACYYRMGLMDEALAQAEEMRQLDDTAYHRSDIFEQALHGNAAEAAERLTAAVREGHLSQAAIRHDPNLNIVLDPARIAEVL